MPDEPTPAWSEPATKGDLVVVRNDMDLLHKDMDLMHKDMDLMHKDMDLMHKDMDLLRKDMDLLEGRIRRRLDVQSVLIVLALLGPPLVSWLASRYLPPLA